ncbi:hypothetical protein AX774_g7649 [Zancudomyces culisetae]|uniref:Uncharacterized protein n=1 Tax=Zancudomyces culisetae TaxID=1213189 RepID=A0A1R1PDB0_ZANCU|nr:hypothetical protein AX774_g7649 [Zancudomyces culisetae]|eukprot:OMH78946.1 hypothetical protein AX774_g7649 [Zancudomyces culisetae]
MFGISEMKSFETQRTSDTMGKGKARESASIADNYITRVKSNSSGLSSPLHGVPTYKSNSRSRDELYRSGTELNRSETDPAFKSYLEHKTKVRKFSEHLVGVVKKRMTGINEESNSDELKRRNDCLPTLTITETLQSV